MFHAWHTGSMERWGLCDGKSFCCSALRFKPAGRTDMSISLTTLQHHYLLQTPMCCQSRCWCHAAGGTSICQIKNPGYLVGGFLQIFRSTILNRIWDDDGRLTTIFRWVGLPPISKWFAQTQAEPRPPCHRGESLEKGQRPLRDGSAIRWCLMFLRFGFQVPFYILVCKICLRYLHFGSFTMFWRGCFFFFHGYVGYPKISIARFPVFPLNLPCPGLEQGLEGWETELKTSTL